MRLANVASLERRQRQLLARLGPWHPARARADQRTSRKAETGGLRTIRGVELGQSRCHAPSMTRARTLLVTAIVVSVTVIVLIVGARLLGDALLARAHYKPPGESITLR